MDALVKAGGWDTASPAQVAMLHRYPLTYVLIHLDLVHS